MGLNYKIKQGFIRFLKTHRVHKRYMEQVAKDRSRFDHLMNYAEPKDFLNKAFSWWRTPQGHHYWDRIDKLWLECCKARTDIMNKSNVQTKKLPFNIKGLQEILDEMKQNPQLVKYVEDRKLSLLDSSFKPIDMLLNAGLLK